MPTSEYRIKRAIAGNPIIDKRKGDRHIKPRKNHKGGKPLSKWDRRVIVAWDGEGANLDDGTHVYNLLANSNGTYIRDDNGLDTQTVLEFFLQHSNPRNINVVYGGSYDVNMFLRDIPIEPLRALWTDGSCFWKGYRIFYAHRKKFTVQKFVRNSNGNLKKQTFVLWDVLGYFQATFVNACRKWLGDLDILDDIERMKFQRSEFRTDTFDDILAYNRQECILLVRLIEALFAALDECGIVLSRYDGAGSIAGALLKKNDIKSHKGNPPASVNRIAQYAYSGGRIEAPKIGNHEGVVYRYDINSAYPSAALSLPSYKDAVWYLDKEWDGTDNSIVHIKWHFNKAPFYPLWYREPDGTILYPRFGEGWYWGSEIQNVIDYHDPKTYEIIEAVNVTLTNDIKPFSFIQETYNKRLMFKAVGSMASESLKLGMNSVYGKLAQQAGYRNGRLPTYHQLLWAGQITSKTRSLMYRMAMQQPLAIIAFATDAIISTKPIEIRAGARLGEWTPERFSGITIVQAGVYWLKSGAQWADKYRGFDKGSLSRPGIVAAWHNGCVHCGKQHYRAELTRFIGMGGALSSSDFNAKWRTWHTDYRVLDIIPNGKRQPGKKTCYWEQLCDTIPTDNNNIDGISSPYPLIWIDGDKVLRDKIDGIDIRIIEEELQDSYA